MCDDGSGLLGILFALEVSCRMRCAKYVLVSYSMRDISIAHDVAKQVSR